MIRLSEMVLPGHPDKFCDQIADAIVGVCARLSVDAYCQVEVSVWSDQVWLSGGLVTRTALPVDVSSIITDTGLAIGYCGGNWVDAKRYQVTNTILEQIGDPSGWTSRVNDQSISIGYAAYDPLTCYLPPEHYLGHVLRTELIAACMGGILEGQGPDGKLLVRMREESSDWAVEQILVTLQQDRAISFLDFCERVGTLLESAYRRIRSVDCRWSRPWESVEILINPYGPLLNGGSDGDNGQTGRKLVMDFYGPRIPIGGGALSGKDLFHIDRVSAYAARDAAVRAVQSGARECLVRLAYAPNREEPLDIDYTMQGRGERQDAYFFRHDVMCDRYRGVVIDQAMAQGGHFFRPEYPWNGLSGALHQESPG